MARTAIKHGAVIDAASPAEIESLLRSRTRSRNAKRVRATTTVKLDTTGNGDDDVYNVPVGFQFEARRVVLDLDTAADPNSGNVLLNIAGRAVEYLRSGSRIEYGAPFGSNGQIQVPGIQTWGSEQGPYLRNGETFTVRVKGLTPNSILTVNVEGILSKPDDPK